MRGPGLIAPSEPPDHHHIAGPYLIRFAQEMAWREDHRQDPNGFQVDRVVALVGAHGRLSGSGEEAAYSAAHAWTIADGMPVRFDEYVNAPLTLPAAHIATG